MNSYLHEAQLARVTRAIVMALTLFSIATSAYAQGQEPQKPQPANLQELREKMQQLEQAMQELKGQIDAVEESQRAPSGEPDNGPGVGTHSYPAARPAKVSGVHASGTELASADASAAVKTPESATANAAKKQSESTLEVYGFAMLDMGYQFKQNDPNWFDVVRATKLPAFNNEFEPDGKWFAGVRQTRFGVKASTPTAIGDLKTIFEFELFGTGADQGQTTFRLRHAYGEVGPIGAGQYWSPFMDIDVFPNTIEYWGPSGMVLFRNVQFRWMPIRGRNSVTIALERPGASADQGIYADRIELQGVRPKFDLPDLSLNGRINRNWGHVQVAGIFRKIKWVDTISTDNINLAGSAFGWGVNVTSALKFGKDTTGKFEFVYGDGIQNYMNDAPVDIGIKNNFSDPTRPIKGVALPLLGAVAYVDHNWNPHFSSTIGYSMLNIYNSNAQNASDYHQGHYASTNLLWTPYPNFLFGTEFVFGRRVNFRDGFNVNDYHLQFSFKYNFSHVFKF